jgi:hypothetical protein
MIDCYSIVLLITIHHFLDCILFECILLLYVTVCMYVCMYVSVNNCLDLIALCNLVLIVMSSISGLVFQTMDQ